MKKKIIFIGFVFVLFIFKATAQKHYFTLPDSVYLSNQKRIQDTLDVVITKIKKGYCPPFCDVPAYPYDRKGERNCKKITNYINYLYKNRSKKVQIPEWLYKESYIVIISKKHKAINFYLQNDEVGLFVAYNDGKAVVVDLMYYVGEFKFCEKGGEYAPIDGVGGMDIRYLAKLKIIFPIKNWDSIYSYINFGWDISKGQGQTKYQY